MNNAHLHLVLNHLPIIFPITGIIILLIGIFTRSQVSKRNAYIVFILGSIASLLAMATGEGAEEVVESVEGVSENLIHRHEEAAEMFAGLSYVLGVFSLGGLISSFKKFPMSGVLSVVVLIMAAVLLYFAQETGRTGGEIRHTEIRTAANVLNGHNAADYEQVGKGEDD